TVAVPQAPSPSSSSSADSPSPSSATPITATPSTPPPSTPRPSTPPPSSPRPNTPTPQNLCGAPANPWNYTFCGGTFISSPPSNFCSYFNCIASFANGRGYVTECRDGTYSKSGGISGSCSGPGV